MLPLSLRDLQPRQIFLLDALGATLSVVMLGGILPSFSEEVGVPPKTLFWLAGLAGVFAVYSFTCFWRTPVKWQPFLRGIAVVNLLYCCLTAVLVFFHENITELGMAYFIVEIIIVVLIAAFELNAARVSD